MKKEKIKVSILALTVALIVVLGMAGSLSAVTTHTVCSAGCMHTSIQEAVDHAISGDTITVSAGTYTENVDITKSVNIIGAGRSVTTVTVASSSDYVFDVSSVDGVNISGFTLSGSANEAIRLSSSDYSKIENINALNNRHGIGMYSSSHNIITDNNVSTSNYMMDTNAGTTNYYGIILSSSSYNTITDNNVGISSYIIGDTNAGISNYIGINVESSSYNTIYNNFFKNTDNVDFGGTVYINYWNTTKQSVNNIVPGPYLGGNYWAKPDGTGSSETCTDADSNGICDSSLTLATNNVDYLPLASYTGVLDSEPPSVTITNPADGSTINIFNDTISGTITDDYYGIDQVSILLNGIVVHSWSGEGNTSISFTKEVNYTAGADNLITVTANDTSNKAASSSVTVTVLSRTVTETVNITANETITVDLSNVTDVVLELFTAENVTGDINVTVGTDITDVNATSVVGISDDDEEVGKFMAINVSDEIQNNLTWTMIKMYYTLADLDRNGNGIYDAGDIDPTKLKFYWYNISEEKWYPLTTGADYGPVGPEVFAAGVDETAIGGYLGTVYANVSHFSVYGMYGSVYGGGGTITTGGGGGGGGGASPLTHVSTGANELDSTTYYNILVTLSAGGKVNKDRFVDVTDTLAGPLLLTKRYPVPTDPTAAQFARTVETMTGDVYTLAAEASGDIRFKYAEHEKKLVIARGDLGVDSMAAVTYAKEKNVPILLVKPNELPSVTEETIADFLSKGDREIVIVGGPVAISNAVEEKLAAKASVKRIYGETRIETAVALAEEAYPNKNKVKAIVITDYENPKIDAALMSYLLDAPLLYVKSDGLSPAVKEYILNHKETIFGPTKVVLMGVDPKVGSEINGLLQ